MHIVSFAYSIGNIPAEHHLSSFFSLCGPIQNQAESPIDHFTPENMNIREFNRKNWSQSHKTYGNEFVQLHWKKEENRNYVE